MAFEDLFAGLNAFKQGVQEYATSQAIGDATSAVQQLKLQGANDQEQRVATMQLGNDLALKLNQIGAPIAQINSTKEAIQPKQYSSAADAYLDASLTGNTQLQKKAQDLQSFQAAPDQAKAKQQHNFEIQKLREQYSLMKDLQETKNAGKPSKIKPLATSELNKIVEFDDGINSVAGLLKNVDDYSARIGPLAGRDPVRNLYPTEAAFDADLGRMQATYRKSISGAGVSDAERAELIELLPKKTDTVAVFKAKADSYMSKTKAIQDNYINRLHQGGRDVSQFRKEQSSATSSAAPAGTHIETRTSSKTGQQTRVYVDTATGKAVGVAQ